MIGISFLFWCTLIGIFAACAIPFFILGAVGFWKRFRLIQLLGCVPAIFILASAGVLFYLVVDSYANPSSEITNPRDIRSSFQANVGIEPGPDVVPLKERIYNFDNFGCIHLTFRASSATFDQIVALGFDPVSAAEFSSETDKDTPVWWEKPGPSETGCLKNPRWTGPFSTNRAYLYYDRASGIVYFYSEGDN